MKFLKSVFLLWSQFLILSCFSAGMSTHSSLADRALTYFNRADYKSLLHATRSYYQPGTFFPDFGYNCRGYGVESESAHWPRFLNFTVNLLRDKYPKPWNSEVEGTFSFMFGIMAHSVSDDSWHSLSMSEGIIEMMRYVEFGGSFGDAHTVADVGGEFVLKNILGLKGNSELVWNVPTADLVEAYSSYYNSDLTEEDINFCIRLGYVGVWANELLGDLAYPYAQKSPALLEEYEDYFLGGYHDMAAWTSRCWEDLVNWIEIGGYIRPMCTILENQWDHTFIYNDIENQKQASKKLHGEKSMKMLTELGFSLKQTSRNGVTTFELYREDGKDVTQFIKEYTENLEKEIQLMTNAETCVIENQVTNSTATMVTTIEYSHFGKSLISGDFNNDGLDDLAIGEPLAGKIGLHQGGLVHILNGKTSRYSQQNDINEFASVTLSIESPYARFGQALAIVDLNRDGIDDLAVSAPTFNGLEMYYDGKVFVYFGSNKGLSVAPDVTIKVDQMYPDANHPFKFTLMGYNLESNDIDGDGFKDLIIGSPLAAAHGKGHQTGLVSIFLSSSRHSGIRDIYDDADMELFSDIDYERFGSDLAVVESSGKKILIVGAHTHKESEELQETGKIYGYDLNDLSSPLFTISGNQEKHRFGSKIIAADFFKDGRTLIAVSAPSEKFLRNWHAGAVYVIDINGLQGDLSLSDVKVVTTFQGGEKGGQFGSDLVVTDDAFFISEAAYGNIRSDLKAGTGRVYEYKLGSGFPSRVVRDRVSESNRCIYGNESRGRFGQSMTKGDFDGDGKLDLVVASTHSSLGASSAGKINLYYL